MSWIELAAWVLAVQLGLSVLAGAALCGVGCYWERRDAADTRRVRELRRRRDL